MQQSARSTGPLEEELELKVRLTHEGIYYFRDIQYIIRIIRKISRDLPNRYKDIDWLQNYIESFLVLNSRFYEDLVVDLVKEVRKQHLLPDSFNIRSILEKHKNSLSAQYHIKKRENRNKAAHGSNYQRIGIPEFDNDVLPRPIRYKPTFKPPLFHMASRKDLISMWQVDMFECADNINTIIKEVASALNTFTNGPFVEQKELKVREGMDIEDFFNDLEKLNRRYETMRPMKTMSQLEAFEVMIGHHKAMETLTNKYFVGTDSTKQ